MAYCDRAFLERYFARTDIEKWADRDNLRIAADIDANVTDALESATCYINDYLRGGPYVVPFADPVPWIIKDLTRKYAGALLYGGRGIQDLDVEGLPMDRLSAIREECRRVLRQIRAGQVRLNVESYTNYPVVFPVALEADSDLTT